MDALAELAGAGVAAVNWRLRGLASTGTTSASWGKHSAVSGTWWAPLVPGPVYLAAVAFKEAFPPGSRVLGLPSELGSGGGRLRAHASLDGAACLRLLLLNVGTRLPARLSLRLTLPTGGRLGPRPLALLQILRADPAHPANLTAAAQVSGYFHKITKYSF